MLTSYFQGSTDDASLGLYEALSKYSDLENLIADGEAEGLHLECKAPGSPRLGKGLKKELAEAISGFSNTAGGVILWGISTIQRAHSGLDVLTQIEPIGQCGSFLRQLEAIIPTLTTPPVLSAPSKTIKRRSKDTQGVVATHIPRHIGDPVQSNLDHRFYFRSGGEFTIAPYQMIQRLFLATDSPDLRPRFEGQLVKLAKDGFWEIPIIVENQSSAVGQHAVVSIVVLNASACDQISSRDLVDESHLNIGKTVFRSNLSGVVHRGINTVVGTLRVKMKMEKRARRVLRLSIEIYADKMRAWGVEACVQLAKKRFSVKLTNERYLY